MSCLSVPVGLREEAHIAGLRAVAAAPAQFSFFFSSFRDFVVSGGVAARMSRRPMWVGCTLVRLCCLSRLAENGQVLDISPSTLLHSTPLSENPRRPRGRTSPLGCRVPVGAMMNTAFGLLSCLLAGGDAGRAQATRCPRLGIFSLFLLSLSCLALFGEPARHLPRACVSPFASLTTIN